MRRYRIIATIAQCAVAGAWLSPARVAQAADAPLFAAPSTTGAAGATSGATLGEVTLALAVVLAFVFVAAWALRNVRKLNIAGGAQQIHVLSQVALGSKERAVLIRVKDQHVLVGVTPGQVTALHTFTAPEEPVADSNSVTDATAVSAASGTAPTFQSLLKQSLGLSKQ